MAKKTKPQKPADVEPTPPEETMGDDAVSVSNKPAPTPEPKIVRSDSKTAPKNRKMWWWIGGSGMALIAIVTILGFAFLSDSPVPAGSNSQVVTNSVDSLLAPRLLDGVLVAPDKTNPNLYAVMIENLTDSRPPSNLDKASVVYEALAEGGISRFLAIYPVGETIEEIGPVRSARPYYIAWAEEYNKPLYVHIGGSPQALDYLRSNQANVIDFNQFRYAPHFWRDKTRAAPHNVYTSTEKLFIGLKRIAPDAVPEYTPWQFQDETAIDDRPSTVNDIVIEYSSFNYRATFKYNRAANVYDRYQGDTKHVTRQGQNIAPHTVVVMFVKTSLVPGDRQRLQMETTGEGRLLVFRNGQKVEGTWRKTGSRDRLQLLDADGQPIKLNRGMIWISAVPTDRDVTF